MIPAWCPRGQGNMLAVLCMRHSWLSFPSPWELTQNGWDFPFGGRLHWQPLGPSAVIQSPSQYLLRLLSESCSSLGRQDATWENFLWKNEAPACVSHSRNGQKECVVDSICPRHLVKDLICWGGQFAPKDYTGWNTDWAHNPERSRISDISLEMPLMKVMYL